MPVISIANQKGGVAKTTSAINIAAALAQKGYKTLLIDIDPQANTTSVFIHPDPEVKLEESLYIVLTHFASLSGIIRTTRFPNLSYVPSHIRLSGIDLELASAMDNRSARLKKALNELREQYDYIIIDNPPSLGLLTINAFTASDSILIPVSTAYFALTGLVQLKEAVDMVQEQLNPNLRILGIVCTFTDHTNVSRDVTNQIRNYFGDLAFQTTIPKNIKLEEAHSHHVPVFEHSPGSAGAEAYEQLVMEVLER